MTDPMIQNYLSDAIEQFRYYKKLAEKAFEQVSDEQFFQTIDPESNSIAVIVKHIAGNQRSRWTDFLTTDGEKDFRNRDTEFEIIGEDRQSLMEFWESGWVALFNALEPITPEDFSKTVTIRGQEHSIAMAINRQLCHYSYHIGQIVFLAKHLKSSNWKTLSVPKNRSAEFNTHMAAKTQTPGSNLKRQGDEAMEFAENNPNTVENP